MSTPDKLIGAVSPLGGMNTSLNQNDLCIPFREISVAMNTSPAVHSGSQTSRGLSSTMPVSFDAFGSQTARELGETEVRPCLTHMKNLKGCREREIKGNDLASETL